LKGQMRQNWCQFIFRHWSPRESELTPNAIKLSCTVHKLLLQQAFAQYGSRL